MSSFAARPPLSTPDEADFAFTREIELRPRSGWIAIDWRELLDFHELLFFLTWRDIKVRYKQTVLGLAWAVLQPVFNVIIFTIFFGNIADFKSKLNVPYSLWVYASLLPWTMISSAITIGGLSLINSQNLLTKTYFPRLFVPTASIGSLLVDATISAALFFVLAAFYGTRAHLAWTIFFLPLLLVPTILISLGFAYILSALTVAYRDFRFVIPFFAQALLYGSFIMVPLPHLKMHWRLILSINPVFGLTDAFRAACFGQDFRPWSLVISLLSGIALVVMGLYYFRKTERRFADIA